MAPQSTMVASDQPGLPAVEAGRSLMPPASSSAQRTRLSASAGSKSTDGPKSATVRFNEQTRVIQVPNKKQLGPKLRKKLWITHEEFERGKEQCRNQLSNLVNEQTRRTSSTGSLQFMVDGESDRSQKVTNRNSNDSSNRGSSSSPSASTGIVHEGATMEERSRLRGLEMVNPMSAFVRQKRSQEGLVAVLVEQGHQQTDGVYDDAGIHRAYKGLTEKAYIEAQEKAQIDSIAVREYLENTSTELRAETLRGDTKNKRTKGRKNRRFLRWMCRSSEVDAV